MSNFLTVEVLAKFEEARDCAGLLYSPPDSSLSYRATRVYDLEFEGERGKAESFAEKVLVDAVGDRWVTSGDPVLDGFSFYLEYWMKPGVLDLEKKAIVDYAKSHSETPIEILSLKIRHRIYVFGDGGKDADFVRDICNPAIHAWTVKIAS